MDAIIRQPTPNELAKQKGGKLKGDAKFASISLTLIN